MISDAINKLFPYFEDYFQSFGNLSLLEIQRHFKSYHQNASKAFIKACTKETTRLYGKTNALLLEKALASGGACYFANHGGFENHPQLIASTLSACSYESLEGGHIHPIFACTTIGSRSPTVPSGMLSGRLGANFKRLESQFYSSKYKDTLLKNLPLLDVQAIDKAVKQAKNKGFFKTEIATFETIKPLLYAYKGHNILDVGALFNTAAYSAFLPDNIISRTLFLDIDKIATELLIEDLLNPKSFISIIINKPEALKKILQSLCGVAGCWSADLLFNDLSDPKTCTGTVLFYELNKKGRKIPLKIVEKNQNLFLCGQHEVFKLIPEVLYQKLKDQKIIPCLYTLQTNLAFTHNLALTGGIFMRTYFEAMTIKSVEILKTYGYDYQKQLNVQPLIMASSMPLPFLYRVNSTELIHDPLAKINQVHPLALLDLFSFRIEKEDLKKLMSAKLNECKYATACDLLLEYGNKDMILENLTEITENRNKGLMLN